VPERSASDGAAGRNLLRLDRVEQAKAWAGEAMSALRGFAGVFKVSVGDVKLGLSEPVRADSGNLEVDLPELLVILIDEVQYLTERRAAGADRGPASDCPEGAADDPVRSRTAAAGGTGGGGEVVCGASI
jgi:hypothetical protein